jgi:chromosome segregation ATPase
MPSQRENDQIGKLATQVAVLDVKLTTMQENMTEQRADIKSINASIQTFTFVKEQDYQKDLRQTSSVVKRLEERVAALESNTSAIVKVKNAIGERGTQLLVLAFFALIFFSLYLIYKHTTAAELLNGGVPSSEAH